MRTASRTRSTCAQRAVPCAAPSTDAAASDGWTGTFLFDCDRLREAHKLKDRAVSLWSHVEARRRDFKNPTYRPDDRVIYPLVGRQHLVLFDAWFQRWHGAVNGVYWDAD